MSSWLEELLLESPIPESNWMPSRAERLADARLTLRRRFGQTKERSARPPHRLRDLGSAHPLFSATRIVPGDRIEADLERDITSVNPPILQGWAVWSLGIVGIAMFLGLASFGHATREPDLAAGLLGLAVPPLVWGAVVLLWGLGQTVIELDADGVSVSAWSSAWLRRRGQLLGPPGELRATLIGPYRLSIEGPRGERRLWLRLWPPSARADVVDELPAWGVACDFGRHRDRHLGRWRRSRR